VLETPHVIVGATIASKIANPILAIPLAFASHFVLDKTPHWNPHLSTEMRKYGKITDKSTKLIIVDVGLSLVSGFFIAYLKLPNYNAFFWVLMGAFAGVLPDVIEGPYYYLKVRSKALTEWLKLQKAIQSDAGPIPGLLTQFVTVAAAFWWLFN
jgi:hypothetical protein